MRSGSELADSDAWVTERRRRTIAIGKAEIVTKIEAESVAAVVEEEGEVKEAERVAEVGLDLKKRREKMEGQT